MLRSLFPSGIPVEAYDHLPEILRLIDEAQRLAQSTKHARDVLQVFLSSATVESQGARLASVELYQRYMEWLRQHHPGIRCSGWREMLQDLESCGVIAEQTTEGWYVVDRRLV